MRPLVLNLFLSLSLLMSSHDSVFAQETPDMECRCNSDYMDILTIIALQHGVDILDLSFGRSTCGEAPQCGGMCDFRFRGVSVPIPIPCESFTPKQSIHASTRRSPQPIP